MGALSTLLGNRTAQKSNLCYDIFDTHGRTDGRTHAQAETNTPPFALRAEAV